MQSALRFNVNLMCFLGRLKPSEKLGFSIDAYPSLPKPTISLNAKESRLVVAPRFNFILNIHGLSDIAQVTNPIVGFVPVNVVNVYVRPLAVNIKPNEAMHKGSMTINHQLQITPGGVSGNLTGSDSAFVDAPSHNSGFRIVGKKLVEPRLCKHVAPHQSGKPSKVAASGDESPVPRRVSCQTILQAMFAKSRICGKIKPLSLSGHQQPSRPRMKK